MISDPKPKTFRSNKYKNWVKSLSCIKCGRTPCDPHHQNLGDRPAMGLKAPDSQCIPLCPKCHSEYHNKGKETFWGYQSTSALIIDTIKQYIFEELHINPEMLVIEFLTKFLEENGD